MIRIKNLVKCTREQMHGFLNSFDVVLSDCDGVLWHVGAPICGAISALKRLEDLGKRIFLVTNNSSVEIDAYRRRLRRENFEVKPEQIINSAKVITWYLKRTQFRGEAFVIGWKPLYDMLKHAGIKFISDLEFNENNVQEAINAVIDRPSIKAVVTDFDANCNWAKLALAISCLQRDDVQYLVGALDQWVTCAGNTKILGPGPLTELISRQSGRVPIMCGKPSKVLKDYVYEECKITNPRRCLLIGDTINHDMKFGAICGFPKLFIGTGCDTLQDAQKDKETRPDYYLPSLAELSSILDKLSIDKL